MYISYFLPDTLIQFLLKLKFRNNNVTIGKKCILNNKCFFEGYNALYNNISFLNSRLGIGTYIANNSHINYTKIGKFCAIGENVRTYVGLHPTSNFLSIHPSFFSLRKQSNFTFVKNQLFDEHKFLDFDRKYVCEIGNDVWIGNNVTILDGIIIGDGAIIASGAVVSKNVEPYTIVGGIPAKFIKKRFSIEQINELITIKWWDWDFKKLSEVAQSYQSIEQFLFNHSN
jgi:acetyltransferase-like isoleucine patch superfamily enzyme